MHEHDSHRLDAVRQRDGELGAHSGEIGLALHRAVGAHAFVDLDDALEQHLRLDDVFGEDLRPRLVADLERVAEALGDEEQRAVTFALQQRIGGDRSAHFHGTDHARRDRLLRRKAEQIADALHGGIAIGLGILGQKLVGDERAVGPPSDHVGEGAAAIDPEIPAVGFAHPPLRRSCFKPATATAEIQARNKSSTFY
jgi:hypothetical protein